MAVQELPEIQVNSKSPGNTPEVVAAVLNDLGYNVSASEVVSEQPTPEEEANAERIAAEAQAETERVESEKIEQAAEKERTTRAERRRLAKEADKKAIADATSRADGLERQVNEFRESQVRLQREIEDIRKNPPKAEVEPAPPAEPKRPTRAEFLTADDPEAAYEDALLEFGDLRREYKAQVAERAKPKPEVKKEDPPPAAAQPTYSDAELGQIDISKIPQPPLRRFMESVKTVTATHPGAYKAIVDNVPNVNDAIIQAGHTFDDPARIQLYLAKHPEESKRIKGLTDGNVQEDPRKLRIAQRELEKVEQMAAEEDAASAVPAIGSEIDDEQPPVDPETDASAARQTSQPQRPAAAAPRAAAPVPKKQMKHEPISPVGARGAQTEKRYEDMTQDEQRKLSPDEVRKLRGML